MLFSLFFHGETEAESRKVYHVLLKIVQGSGSMGDLTSW